MKTAITIILLLFAAFFLLAVICAMINSGRISEQERQEKLKQLLTKGG